MYRGGMATKRDDGRPLWATGGFDNVFEEMFGKVLKDTKPKEEMRIVDSDEHKVVYELDLPGVKRADLRMTVKGQVITVAYALRGKSHTSSWTAPEEYDPIRLTSRLEDGVMTLFIPRASPEKTQETVIEVK